MRERFRSEPSIVLYSPAYKNTRKLPDYSMVSAKQGALKRKPTKGQWRVPFVGRSESFPSPQQRTAEEGVLFRFTVKAAGRSAYNLATQFCVCQGGKARKDGKVHKSTLLFAYMKRV